MGSSTNKSCKCEIKNWAVVTRNGCRVKRTIGPFKTTDIISSNYSTVKCLNCGCTWRTKEEYVDKLMNINDILFEG